MAVADVEQRAITEMSAREMATRIASGELSAREVVDAHIRRIEEVNPVLNAVVAPRFAQARAEADQADAARARGELKGPLHGVPMTAKEQFDVEGLPTTFGLPSRAKLKAKKNGPLLSKLRDNGAIILGKTNIPQLLFYQEGDNPVYGLTKNPWNPERTTGGGTAGEGAIIAAGGSPIGMAADIGGSIRVPGHFCGVHGFKVTPGRLTSLDSPPHLFFPGMDVLSLDIGVLARHVEDLDLALGVMSAPGTGGKMANPWTPPVAWPSYRDVSIEGMRVAMFVDDGFFPASPALRRAVREAAEALRSRGVTVEEIEPPDSGAATALYFSVLASDGLAWVKPLLRNNPVDRRVKALLQISAVPDAVKPLVSKALALAGQQRLSKTVTSAYRRDTEGYWQITLQRNKMRDRFMATMDRGRYDAVICPPHALAAVRHGDTSMLFSAASYAVLFNVLGLPTGVLAATRVRPGEESDRPAGVDIVDRTAREAEQGTAGLPVGVQVAGLPWREDVILALMSALEEHFKGQPDYPNRPPLQ